MSAAESDEAAWKCPKPDCHEGIDAHPLAKFLDHLHYDEPKFTAEDAQEVADRVLEHLDTDRVIPPEEVAGA